MHAHFTHMMDVVSRLASFSVSRNQHKFRVLRRSQSTFFNSFINFREQRQRLCWSKPEHIEWVKRNFLFGIGNVDQILGLKCSKLTRSTSAYALPLFCPAPKIREKITFQKYLHSWEQPKNSFPYPVLTYHFLVPIGALALPKT